MKNSLEKYINFWLKIWDSEERIEQMDYRVSTVMSSFGAFAEGLAAILYNAKGDSSDGLGYDLITNNGDEVIEVKSCVIHKNKDCKKCGTKNVSVNRKCHKCLNTLELTNSTSRFSINSKNIVDFKDNCKKIVFVSMENTTGWDKRKITVWDLSFENKNSYFYKLCKNQYVNSTKSKNLNFLPNSYDFLLSLPVKRNEILIEKKQNEYEINSISKFSEPDKKIKVDILYKKEIEELNSKGIEEVNEHFNISDVAEIIGIRKKSLNKNRGKISSRATSN